MAVLAYNRIEWLELYVALARAGLVALPLNFRLVSDELAYILKDAQVSALVCAQSLQDKVLPITGTLPLKTCVQMDGATEAGWIDYEALIQHATVRTHWTWASQ